MEQELFDNHPHCNHVTDIAKQHKEMEYRMDIFYFMETVQHSSYYIADTFGYDPEEYPSVDTFIELLNGNKDNQSHENKTARFDVIVFLQREEAYERTYNGT